MAQRALYERRRGGRREGPFEFGMSSGHVIADRFEVIEIAASGGMAAVYRARDRHTGDTVGIKLMRDASRSTLVRRFEREAELLSQLRHPGIVRHVAHGFSETGEPYLVMEWLEGADLAALLARRPISYSESVGLVTRVAEALVVAHQLGVVHRDVKPENIFLVRGELDHVKLLDFGIARTTAHLARLTRTGMAPGTPAYMAPEQARGESDVGPASDVYGLGAVLFTCLAGRPPFLGSDPVALITKVALEDPPALREVAEGVPVPLERLVGRMLGKRPEDRPADAAELVAALRALPPVEGSGNGARPNPVPELTLHEKRLASLLLCPAAVAIAAASTNLEDSGERAVGGSSEVATRPDASAPVGCVARLRHVADQNGATLTTLVDGTVVAVATSQGTASDLAARVARCALAFREILPDTSLSLTTSRASTTSSALEVLIDRAAVMLRPELGGARGIRIDEVTAGLLGASFDIVGDDAGLRLNGRHPSSPGAPTFLRRRAPCIGRGRELATLDATWSECVEDHVSRMVLLTAPTGMGKSRLLHELVSRIGASDDAPEIFVGQGDPMRAGSPFALLTDALRRWASLREDEPPAARRALLRARVGRHVQEADLPRITDFLGRLLQTADETGGPALRAARQDPALMGDQLKRAFCDLVEAVTDTGPLLFVLEDAHWGDLPSMSLLEHVLRSLPERPLLAVVSMRPDPRAPLPDAWPGVGVLRIQLGPLTRRSARRLAREALGDQVDESLLEEAVQQAGGHPLHLQEILRNVAAGRGCRSEALVAMVQARLEALETDARRVLRAASVFGEVFWAGGVRALLGGEGSTRVTDWLAELVERELIAPHEPGRFRAETEYRFVHGLARDAAYEMLTEEDRTLGHRLAAQWLQAAGETDGATIADHYQRGGEPARAVSGFVLGARKALEGNDLEAALEGAERGIACGAEGADLGALRLLQARAHRWRGENPVAEERAIAARGLLPRGSTGWYAAAGELAVAAGRLGHVDRLIEIAAALGEVEPEAGAAHARSIAAARTVIQLVLTGHLDVARRLVAQADDGDQDLAVFSWLETARFYVAHQSGEVVPAIGHVASAVAGFERLGDLREACMQRINVGWACAEAGAYERAEDALRVAVAEARALRLDAATAIAEQNLGYVVAAQGRVEEGLAIIAATESVFCAQHNKMMEGATHLYMARLLMRLDRLDDAERQARRAVDGLAEYDGLRAYALATLAAVELAGGRPEPALVAATQAAALADQGERPHEGDAMVRLQLARALHAVGDREAADHAIADACGRLLRRAKRIRDPEMHRSFLSRVAEHAQTIELADAWLR